MNKLYASALALLGCATPLFSHAQAGRAQSQPGRAEILENRVAPVVSNDNPGGGRNCATMEVFETQMATDPAMSQRMAAIEAQTKRYMSQPAMLQRVTAGTPVVIPVVVHVVYNTAAQNVSQAEIDAQIRVLNEDFAKTNADASKIPGAFTGVASATNVQFVLAKRDPSGRATTGVLRVATKTRSFSSNDAVKSSSRGGSNAWPRDQYLNLWLCNLGRGLLGYAQFPGGPAATDGVVCLYSSTPGGAAANYDGGRTATHEVGHWLNLRHIWGDATCGNDLVADTPTQQTSNGGCPVFPKVTCNNQGDMSMNYMDYTYDRCMYMFTAGQASRMEALFGTGGARASLLSSQGGVALRNVAAAPATLYPNPAANVLNVDLTATVARGASSVRVFDMQGREMTQARYNGNGQVEVGSLPKGLYHVRIASGGQVVNQRFEKE
ncbi:MAG TPA: M43 family zinc metalloprotease [Hymenobacter sp.]|jgi:hypothetical protein|uniref:M43 family zinc metalloprotease n=1 Tax=Hymenobacter sp. TaxID=1898978 RepID=UPI002ED96FC4